MKFENHEAQECIQATSILYKSLQSQLARLSAAEQAVRPSGEWSKKEILGHCCDATATNVQRVVRAQYEDKPPRCVYNQAEWVKVQNYALYNWDDLVQYWYIGNKHLLNIYENMPISAWFTSIVWGSEERSAVWFFHHHFVRHTFLHLQQILPEAISVPDSIPQFDMAGNLMGA